MCEALPIKDFKWIEPSEEKVTQILQMSDDSKKGFFLEVDLCYPAELHNKHNDYPFCAEHMVANDSKQQKLILNLHDKNKYVLHYRSLKLALKHGLVLKKVYRILQFIQSKWLKPFIDLNTKLRTEAKNDFEKNLYKLMSNAIYGKFIENVRKRKNTKLVSQWDGRYGAQSLISKPSFKNRIIFNENLVAIEMMKTNVKLNKPILVGVSVLEISKTLMYRFHYDFMLKKFSYKNCNLMYTDTDSFIYCIKNADVYSLMRKNPEKFDTSDFRLKNRFNIQLLNKKVPGLMKDESKGKIVREFVGLRAKAYSLKVQQRNSDKITKRAKGVKKHIIEGNITFNDFVSCLDKNVVVVGKQPLIKSKLHKVFSIEQRKRLLDGGDDKRCILANGINTLAWGHYKIR